MNTSGLGTLAGTPSASTLPPETTSRVEMNAMMLPSSLMVASRLSSATKGGQHTPLPEVQVAIVNPGKMPPGEGARLAGVLVIRVNVPPVKSAGVTSAPVGGAAVSATVN